MNWIKFSERNPPCGEKIFILIAHPFLNKDYYVTSGKGCCKYHIKFDNNESIYNTQGSQGDIVAWCLPPSIPKFEDFGK